MLAVHHDHSGMKQLLQHKIRELIAVCNILMVFMRQQQAIVTDACATMCNNAFAFLAMSARNSSAKRV